MPGRGTFQVTHQATCQATCQGTCQGTFQGTCHGDGPRHAKHVVPARENHVGYPLCVAWTRKKHVVQLGTI
eukprot:4060263-Pyramimonas_sp.AAC.1